ncbi:hypothetical protein ACQJBY_009458 [Aegilops geniculata]
MIRTWRGGGWLTLRMASHQSNYTTSPRSGILKKIHVGLACLTSCSNDPLQALSRQCSVHKSVRDVKAVVASCQLPIKCKPIMLSFSSTSTKKLQQFYMGNYDISCLLLCTLLVGMPMSTNILCRFFAPSAFSAMDVCMRAMCVSALQQFV